MRCAYGQVEFEISRVLGYTRESVFTPDRASLLYTHHAVRLLCYLNVADASIPALAFRSSPVEQDNYLREYLQGPRRRLLLWLDANSDPDKKPLRPGGTAAAVQQIANQAQAAFAAANGNLFPPNPAQANVDLGAAQFILISPPLGFPTDARTGPQCSVLSIARNAGNKDLILDLQFETDLAPALMQNTLSTAGAGQRGLVRPQAGAQQALTPQMALLANRWTWRVDTDEDHFVTHNIDGEAYFRLDVLHALGCQADLLRPLFLHPIPLGFRRVVGVSPSSDNSAVRYQIIDTQQAMNFPGGIQHGATRVEVRTSQEHAIPNDIEYREGHMIGLGRTGSSVLEIGQWRRGQMAGPKGRDR